ncbi:MAG: ABC transporter permease [Candidatus Tectimicrobiota bacterium]
MTAWRLASGWRQRLAEGCLPVAALALALVLFGGLVALAGTNPFTAYGLMYLGGFGTWFSWQNTLQRAAPLILTALCTAIPAHLGLVIIGAEGALVCGGLAAAVIAGALPGGGPWLVQLAMALAAMLAGGTLILSAGALRHWRGVNETISSLLLTYIAIAVFHHLVEGPLRDPASLNKPSTVAIGEANMLGGLPGMEVHWGLLYGLVACVLVHVLLARTTFGFAARIVGGNPRAAQLTGLPIGRLLLTGCALAGAAAGLAGMIEVAAVHGRANASLVVGYGYSGILVSFLARHQPLLIVPVALLLGGIGASGGLLQRRLGLPDATVLVFQGVLFVILLASESLRERLQAPRRVVT